MKPSSAAGCKLTKACRALSKKKGLNNEAGSSSAIAELLFLFISITFGQLNHANIFLQHHHR